jgi:hypothetical protein
MLIASGEIRPTVKALAAGSVFLGEPYNPARVLAHTHALTSA